MGRYLALLFGLGTTIRMKNNGFHVEFRVSRARRDAHS
jgi:hypothetical protein